MDIGEGAAMVPHGNEEQTFKITKSSYEGGNGRDEVPCENGPGPS